MGRSRRILHAALEESATPPDTLAPTQSLARVIQAEGNNLYSCLLPASNATTAAVDTDSKVLVELDARFRNTVFMRRGGYVLVDLESAGALKEAGRRVMGQIVNVVRDEKAWRKQKYWPREFAKATVETSDDEEESNMGKMPPSDSEDEE
ncbi:eukaryotic translation initiation factor eif1a-like protein [Grosmannia clavigera kw1407]|uniref:Eukaryotic translation initiation factor eif1a-like protein n=1 Tax=Grosmannia clavigera (strain kw1407 / UAMH 11150) TaxID=655863 RepID=F0X8A7_GROCL|nr:eukaryotic translation initiation factor eif1a-like protein [Grosmannia clavigera kw1407]EFX06057.1 eukaryotic translation initiation factor eif1a-like protein [Grosmannia clavigera kw1407]